MKERPGIFGFMSRVVKPIREEAQRRGIAPDPPPPPPPSLKPPGVVEPLKPVKGIVEIRLPVKIDTGQFARYVPFGDDREVIVRRGPAATGVHSGFEQSRRRVQIDGGTFEMITFQNILSPPVHVPGQPLLGDDEAYRPVQAVLCLPGVEVMLQRTPRRRGFSDDEVDQILKAIRVHPA